MPYLCPELGRFRGGVVGCVDTDLTPLRHAHPGLMDFIVWLNRTGQVRLLAQLESTPA